MGIQPQGEELRQAVKWIDEELRESPDRTLGETVAQACVKFDLSPMESQYLERFYQQRDDH